MSDQYDLARLAAIDSGVGVALSGASGPGYSVDPLQEAFDGWMALADVVVVTSPDLADLMVVLANLARVAAEEQIPSWLDFVTDRFRLSRDSYGGIWEAIRANAFPLSAEILVEELTAIYARLPSDVADLIQSSENGLSDAIVAQFRQTPLLRNAEETYRQCLHEVKDLAEPPQILLEASCSLEQPSLLGPREAERGEPIPPIQCARLAHTVWRDWISVAEYTYGQSLSDSFGGKVFGPGPVGEPRVDINPPGLRGYRSTIDDTHVEFFWSTIRPGVTSRAYTIHLTEGTQFQRASKTAARMLEQHRADISHEIEQRVKSSSEEIAKLAKPALTALGVAAAAVNPIVHTLVPLAAAASAAAVKFVVDKIIKALRGGNLTTWTIGHTVITGADWVPLSVFTLSHVGPPNLRRLIRDSAGKPQVSDYPYDPDIWRNARFMFGVTHDYVTSFDRAYFDLVVNGVRPLAWDDPWETNGGFRVLLPHSRPGSDAMYVSAVRADIRYGSATP